MVRFTSGNQKFKPLITEQLQTRGSHALSLVSNIQKHTVATEEET